jgi:Dyp-type peroxidase family
MSDTSVQWGNVQALVMSSFPALPHAAYMLFRFHEAGPSPQSRAWLGKLCDRTANALGGEAAEAAAEAESRQAQAPIYVADLVHLKALKNRRRMPRDVWAANVAFTRSGLAALGASEAELGRFSDEFREGMAPPRTSDGQPGRRSSLLGDFGASSPAHWRWGGWSGGSFDGMLLLYARTPASLRRLVDTEIRAMRGAACPLWCRPKANECARVERGRLNSDGVGHFGLKDGISQPVIAGTPRVADMPPALQAVSVVAAGEFILGYKDTRGAIVRYDDLTVPGSRDLALNGTYLAVRQLEQNVKGFRSFVRTAARVAFGSDGRRSVNRLTSKLLGRSPDGEPLVPPPEGCQDESQRLNGFRYDAEDRDGLACPLGSHVRRANPRDMVGPDRETALRLSRMHRLVRRGRSYGPRRRGDGKWPPGAERGIFFISVCSSLAGQFELVQHSWINNPSFKDLAEVDPLSHVPGGTITIQSRPGNIRLLRPEPFVRVRGGAYFFMPGINAMRELAAAPAALQPEPG